MGGDEDHSARLGFESDSEGQRIPGENLVYADVAIWSKIERGKLAM